MAKRSAKPHGLPTREQVLEFLQTSDRIAGKRELAVSTYESYLLRFPEPLERADVPILGTSPDAIDLAEDRERFAKLVADLGLKQPANGIARSLEEAIREAERIGYPVLLRPSYVLGGRAMEVVENQAQLETYIATAVRVSGASPVLVDQYLRDAIEVDVDALADGIDVSVAGIMQHIEPAGIHSGDSYAVLPPYNLGDFVLKQIENYTRQIAVALRTVGLINIQYAIKNDKVYVIEANPRASRTVPFICKAYDEPYVNYATKIMLGEKKVTDFSFNPTKKGYAIKVPVFSFNKFPDVNKELGPEMKSTGEAIYFIDDLMDDYFLSIYNERNLYLSR